MPRSMRMISYVPILEQPATPNAIVPAIYLLSLSMTYGTSMSSSVVSSQVISRMTFFWCSGIFFLLMVSTSWESL